MENTTGLEFICVLLNALYIKDNGILYISKLLLLQQNRVKCQKSWDISSNRVGPPFVRRSAATLRDIDSTCRRKSFEEIFSHTASTAVHNCESAGISGFCALADLSIMYHIFSMVYISGDLAANSIAGNVQNVLQINREIFWYGDMAHCHRGKLHRCWVHEVHEWLQKISK
ncbi:hypothetical protein AVEN_115047-1 [Araneus ventricosus]|uniref:Uncharacterized protein n=1 Tax=Araneus ventricosus TaxID=182803 RepID=A0A4Y1ZY86_ARAVE|nr:hypothetical protein AVEN_115047-1 [Araneus ventricosus]